jgi:hypothetical protein
MATIARSGKFPTLVSLVEHDIDFNLDEFFEFGLKRLLDGIANLLE